MVMWILRKVVGLYIVERIYLLKSEFRKSFYLQVEEREKKKKSLGLYFFICKNQFIES